MQMYHVHIVLLMPDDDYLEFLSIKVQDGPLTSKLQHIKVGDIVEVSRLLEHCYYVI